MKRVTLCIIIVLFYASLGWSLDIAELDGNDWRKWDKNIKPFYVTGFMLGSGYVVNHHRPSLEGYDNEKASLLTLKVDSLKKKDEKITLSKEDALLLESRELFVVGQSLSAHELVGMTVGQLGDGLDALYADFKNRSIKLTDAVYIVKKQIKGTPKEDIEQILLFFRSGKRTGLLDKTDIDVLVQATVDGKMAPSQFPEGGAIVVKDKNGKFVKIIDFP